MPSKPRQLHPVQAAQPPKRVVQLMKVMVQAVLVVVTLAPDGSILDVSELPTETVAVQGGQFHAFPAALRQNMAQIQKNLDSQGQGEPVAPPPATPGEAN